MMMMMMMMMMRCTEHVTRTGEMRNVRRILLGKLDCFRDLGVELKARSVSVKYLWVVVRLLEEFNKIAFPRD
jgi:hypothetical protein